MKYEEGRRLDAWLTTDRDGEDESKMAERIEELWNEKLEGILPAELLDALQKFEKWTDAEALEWLLEGRYKFVDHFNEWDADRQLDFLEGL